MTQEAATWHNRTREDLELLAEEEYERLWLGKFDSDRGHPEEDINKLEASVDGLLNIFGITSEGWGANVLKARRTCDWRWDTKEEVQQAIAGRSAGRYLYDKSVDGLRIGDDLDGDGGADLAISLSDMVVAELNGYGDHWGDAIYKDPDSPDKKLHEVTDEKRIREIVNRYGPSILEDNYIDYERDYSLEFRVVFRSAGTYD